MPTAPSCMKVERQPLHISALFFRDLQRSLARHDQTSESISEIESRRAPAGKSSQVCLESA